MDLHVNKMKWSRMKCKGDNNSGNDGNEWLCTLSRSAMLLLKYLRLHVILQFWFSTLIRIRNVCKVYSFFFSLSFSHSLVVAVVVYFLFCNTRKEATLNACTLVCCTKLDWEFETMKKHQLLPTFHREKKNQINPLP